MFDWSFLGYLIGVHERWLRKKSAVWEVCTENKLFPTATRMTVWLCNLPRGLWPHVLLSSHSPSTASFLLLWLRDEQRLHTMTTERLEKKSQKSRSAETRNIQNICALYHPSILQLFRRRGLQYLPGFWWISHWHWLQIRRQSPHACIEIQSYVKCAR